MSRDSTGNPIDIIIADHLQDKGIDPFLDIEAYNYSYEDVKELMRKYRKYYNKSI